MEEIGIESETRDSDRFDPLRNALWEHMRTLYPGIKDLRALKGLKFEVNESLIEYLE